MKQTLITLLHLIPSATSKHVLFLLMMLIGGFHCLEANARDGKTDPLVYDIQCGGSANQGYYLVEVSAYTNKSSKISTSLICRCAVHGVLFKGFAGGQGCTSQRPLAGSAAMEQQHAEFFTTFFQDGGGYATYASIVDGSMRTAKEDKQYKVTAIVTVAKEQLRQDLEKAGILKGLNSGF